MNIPEGLQSQEGRSISGLNVDFSQAEYRRFYSNFVQSTMTLFEIRLMFSSVQGKDPGSGKLVADETLHIIMSPELAVATYNLLQKAIHDYVKSFGPMRFPNQGTVSPASELEQSIENASAVSEERPGE